MYQTKHKSFSSLNLDELYALMRLRQQVFVVEQECVYQDLDGLDKEGIHFLCNEPGNGKLVGYARVLPPGLVYTDMPAIGRVVVDPGFRNKGIGRKIMMATIDYCLHHYEHKTMKISAQTYLLDFYTSLGFKDTGKHYLEDGIPHMAMIFKSDQL